MQIEETGEDKQNNKLLNPLEQADQHIAVLREFLQDNQLSFAEEDIHALVAMVDKYHKLEVEGDTSAIIFARDLPEKFESHLGQLQYGVEEITELLGAFGLKLPEDYQIEPEAAGETTRTETKSPLDEEKPD